MRYNRLYKYLIPSLLMICGISACRDDKNDLKGEPYFLVENFEEYVMPCAGISDAKIGNGAKFTVRANGKWRFEAVDEQSCEWARIYPMEGADDGLIRVYGQENMLAKVRKASYRVYLNDVEQPYTLNLVQQKSQGFLNLTTSLLTFQRSGGQLSMMVDSNMDWECRIEQDPTENFSCRKVDNTQILVDVAGVNNTGAEITGMLVVEGTDGESSIRHEIALVQLDALFFDNFNWLESLAGINGWAVATGQKEIRIDNWSDAEKSHDWKSLSTWVYSRTGFVKFGKGGYGGDLQSPRIEGLGASSDVQISWKALGYGTSKNVKDALNYYHVAILGPGEISDWSTQGSRGDDVQYRSEDGSSVKLKSIRFQFSDNAWLIPALDPTAKDIWQVPDAQFHIMVKGMSKDSRVIFISGDGNIEGNYENGNSVNSRFFLDDYKVIK